MQNLPEFKRTCLGNLHEIDLIVRGICQNLHFWPSKQYIKGPLYEKSQPSYWQIGDLEFIVVSLSPILYNVIEGGSLITIVTFFVEFRA